MEENKTLNELIRSPISLAEALIASEGLVTQEIESFIAHAEVNLPEKVDSTAFVMDRLEAEAQFLKEKAERFLNASRACANARERIKDRVKFLMIENGLDDLSGFDVKFKLSNSKPKLEINPDDLDKAYYMQVTTTEVDKKKIEEDLKSGVAIKGAKYIETKSLRTSIVSKGKT